MVKVSAHNLIVVGLLAAVFFLLLRMLAKTRVASFPIIGSAIKLAAA
jgi:hypothetical protein